MIFLLYVCSISLTYCHAPIRSLLDFIPSFTVDGRQALEVFQQSSVIHLLITDLDMPGMDGFQLTRALRKQPYPWRQQEPSTPVSASSTATTEVGGAISMKVPVELIATFTRRYPVIVALTGSAEINVAEACMQVF